MTHTANAKASSATTEIQSVIDALATLGTGKPAILTTTTHLRLDGTPDRRYKLGTFVDETGRRFESVREAADFYQTRASTVHLVLTRRLQSWRGHVFSFLVERQAAPEPVDGVDLLCAVAAKACGRRMSIRDLSKLVRTNAALRLALKLAAEDLAA